jgi:hypothetical protein
MPNSSLDFAAQSGARVKSFRLEIVVFALSLAVALLTIWLYLPSLSNGFVDWDDYVYLKEAAEHRELSVRTLQWACTSVRPFYYQPLTRLSHVLDFWLWRWNPAGHHLTSILLHGVNAGLVVALMWSVSARISGLSTCERLSLTAAVALVFGIHPLQVESVAWLAERKNVLCGLFSLLCLWTHVRDARGPAFALFVAALLSKPMAVSLPAVMLVLDFYPLQRNLKVGWRKLLQEKIPMVAAVLAISMLTILPLVREGGVAGVWRFGALERVAVAGRSLIFYLWKLLWPRWLSPYYPLEGAIIIRDPEFLASAAAVVAITALAIWNRKRMPAFLAGWTGYLALTLPVSGLVQNGPQAAADRFMYLAILAPVALIASGCVMAFRNLHAAGRFALTMLVISEVFLFGYTTRAQIPVWRNDVTLWREALAHFPNSALANFMIGNGLARQQRYEEAVPFAMKAVALSPDFARAHYGLACIYSRLGRTQESLDALRRALAYDGSLSTLAVQDEDLANLRHDPRLAIQFNQLIPF